MPKSHAASHPWLIIFLLCAFLPEGVTLEIFSRTPTISFFDIAITLVALCLLAKSVLGEFRFFMADHTLNIIMSLYLLANFLSLLFSFRDPLRSILEIKIIVFGYFLYVLTLSVVSSERDVWYVTTGLVLFGCVVSLLLLYLYFRVWSGALTGALTVHDLLLVKSEVEISGGRSNYIASLLVPIFPLAVAILVSGRGKKSLIWLGACLALALGIMVTMSRGAIIGLGLGLLSSLPFLRRRILNPKSMGVALGLLVVFYIVVPKELLAANYSIFSVMLSSVDYSRIDLWRTALKEFSNYPLLGVGPGCIYLYNSQFAINDLYSHNYVLNSLADVGLIGTAPFLLTLVISLRRAYHLASTTFVDPRKRSLAIGLFVGMVATLAHGLVEPTFVAQEYVAIFWITMALITLYGSTNTAQQTGPR